MIYCGECGAEMKLRPSRYGHFYGCTRFPDCRGTHGAHADGRPLGIPADRETREARTHAHQVFDAFWRARGLERNKAYGWLAARLGMSRAACHIARFNREDCRRLVKVVQGEEDRPPRRRRRER
jgi:ssDNA-binding Zn-finger/Zn-ribbon topoisomerase 1